MTLIKIKNQRGVTFPLTPHPKKNMLFSTLFSLWSWTILPDLLTHRLLTFSYQTLNITPTPRRNTATYHHHYTLLFSFLVSIWLCYDLVQFFTKQGEGGYGSFYEMLGVGMHVDENGLKAGFRQVVKKIHPDRNYLNNNVQVEEAFVRVRQVYEALRNPNMRFAYDRFVLPQLHFSFSSPLLITNE